MLESFPPGFLAALKPTSQASVMVVQKKALESKHSKAVYARILQLDNSPNITTDYRKQRDRRHFMTKVDLPNKRRTRVKAIDYRGKVINESYYNALTIAKELGKVRIKSIINDDMYGLKETDWVYFEPKGKEVQAKEMNQYRIRGVGLNGIESEWIYSNLRTFDNEEVLFELLTDFFDVALTMNDDVIDYFVNLTTGDYFTKEILDFLPEYVTRSMFDERQCINYKEITKIAADYGIEIDEIKVAHMVEAIEFINRSLPTYIQETFRKNIEEIVTLVSMYNVSDQTYFDFKNDDFYAMFTKMLDDSIEQLIQNEDMEVIMRNNEEIQVLLQTSFDFETQRDSFELHLDLALNDNITSLTKDILKLVVDKSFTEWYVREIEEESTLTVLNYLNSLWMLMYSADSVYREMLNYADDHYDISLDVDVVEYLLTKNNKTSEYALMLRDLVDIFIQDKTSVNVEPEIFDKLINLVDERELRMLINYMPEEALNMFMEVGHQISSNETLSLTENVALSTQEYTNVMKAKLVEIEEAALIKMIDHYSIEGPGTINIIEEDPLCMMDIAIQEYTNARLIYMDELSLLLDEITHMSETGVLTISEEDQIVLTDYCDTAIKDFFIFNEKTTFKFSEYLKEVFTILKRRIEDMVIQLDDSHDLLWLGNPKDKIPLTASTVKDVFITIERTESIPDWIKERLLYSVGKFDVDWPVGKFTIGKHSLGGKDDLENDTTANDGKSVKTTS